MIDILYIAYNRAEFSRESFSALVENTNWNQVRTLYVHDDGSTDGTREWLEKACRAVECDVVFHAERLGGPVAATNWYLDHVLADYLDPKTPETVISFAKIDNDFVVCPGWLDVLLRLHTKHPEVDIYGFEPHMGSPREVGPGTLGGFDLTPASFVGGKALMRLRAFRYCRPQPRGFNGYFGFSEWQMKHKDVIKAWVTPDIAAFGLDQLPFEPWLSLTDRYVAEGWQRRWDPYDSLDDTYWRWWVAADATRMVG